MLYVSLYYGPYILLYRKTARCIIEYFTKSREIIGNDSWEGPKSPLVLHSNCLYLAPFLGYLVSLKSMLGVTLNVIRNGTIQKHGYGFLLPYCSNYSRIFSCLWDTQRQRMAWPWQMRQGCSRSLKMAPFGRSYTTFCWSAIEIITVSCTIFELFDVE